jgi:hypothetical protein
MSRTLGRLAPVFATLLVAGGCAAAAPPSPELVTARALYRQAEGGSASAFAPRSVDEARRALARAELAFEEEPGSEHERHYAYLAQRTALLALARGDARAARIEREAALRAIAAERAHRTSQPTLESIVHTRSDALVITLRGADVFAPGGATLTAGAEERLLEVLRYLEQLGDDVEVHLVAGDDARAGALRRFFLLHGLAPDRLAPRAAKRDDGDDGARAARVEIVIE